VLQAVQQAAWREQLRARRRQLERERDPIELAADLGYHRRIFGVQVELRCQALHALDEQANRWVRRDRSRVVNIGGTRHSQ
jgi:hypothetical protein